MKLFLFMLVILNPFAQVLYLWELIGKMPKPEFCRVHFRASVLSFGVFGIFVLVGDPLLTDVFQVRLESLQIFGGLVILLIAYRYIVEGPASNLLFRGEITDLAPVISLPYMVGPGTIWLSILIGRQYKWTVAFALVAGVLVINMAFIFLVKVFSHTLEKQRETMVGKYFSILMRTNALFIGAIAVEMILRGIQTAFQAGG